MNIEYSKQAMKAIQRLDKPLKQRIRAGIEELPAGDLKKLKGYRDTFRLRVGEYRVIFEMVGQSISIMDVLPRQGAYKK